MSRLRKRVLIPEDTPVRAILTDTKIVHGNYGRQVEAVTNITEGGENNEFRGVTFKTWFSFGKDKETKEEYIAYGGSLYQLLSLVAPNLDEVLEDENLSDRAYEKFLKNAVKDLEDLDIQARVGVRVNKQDASKKSNFLQPGTFGVYRDLDEMIDEDMAGVEVGAPEAPDFD
jgi:hypothetical protein